MRWPCSAIPPAVCSPTTIRPKSPRQNAADVSPHGRRSTRDHAVKSITSAPESEFRNAGVNTDLAAAMREPRFVPCLGRKSCPLGLPLSPQISDAADASAALLERHRSGPEGWLKAPGGRTLRGVLADPPVATIIVVDADTIKPDDADTIEPGDPRHYRTEFRRDQTRSRRRWQFDLRAEAVLGTETP